MFGRLTVVATVILALMGRSHAACVGDCGGDGEVTVDELISAVNNGLVGCPTGNFSGEYAASVSFDSTHSGTVNLSADANGHVSGSLLVISPRRTRFSPDLSFAFPVGGVSVAVSGTYDPVSGGFEVEGSFIDANGQTTSVVISGDYLPGPTGTVPVNVYVGSDLFTTTLSAGMLATPTPTPHPTPSPGNGPRIAFVSGAPSHIFVINVDGSGKTQISNSVGNDTNPAWSPDGTKVAFSTPDANNDRLVIGIVNADGSNQHRIAEDTAFLDGYPAWSPDGDQIVFTSGGGDNIDVMNADGSGRHRLVTKNAGEIYRHLSWSPDGSRIAVETTRPRDHGSEDRFEIWVMNADGSNFVRLTNNDVPDLHPAWTVDGASIAFSTKPNAFSAPNIFLVSPSGGTPAQLTKGFLGASNPAWSRDGQQLAFSTLAAIQVANADGSSPVAVPGTQAVTDFDFK